MNRSGGFYKLCYCLARAAIGIFHWLKVKGRENIPDGAAIFCINHSSMVDPFLVAFAAGIKTQVHIISKAELFRIPVISWILTKLEMISVDRGILDTKSIKKTLRYLSGGGKVAIFPEGTRTQLDNAITAKNGAVKIAEHAGAPVVPVFIPRGKRLFRTVTLVIGEPYYIEKQSAKRSQAEYTKLAEALMDKINILKPEQHDI